jgi:Fur family transcriptional regulator, ferric uptake regulator
MDRRGLRSTGQRQLICEVFFASREHTSLDEILLRVHAENPRVGYATVYRTMKMLVESGVAHERRFADGVTRYELRDLETHHDHLICINCGKIVEFKEPRIEEIQEQVARRHGFQVRYHKHELYCVCLDEKCAEKAEAQKGQSDSIRPEKPERPKTPERRHRPQKQEAQKQEGKPNKPPKRR